MQDKPKSLPSLIRGISMLKEVGGAGDLCFVYSSSVPYRKGSVTLSRDMVIIY
jgi:hypothetical protein